MPIILALFCALPLLGGAAIEYAVCRFPRHRWWRPVPPCAAVVICVLTALGRYRIWTSQNVAPWTQLIFFPGLPGVFLLLGMLLGWRWWKRRWSPRVIDDK